MTFSIEIHGQFLKLIIMRNSPELMTVDAHFGASDDREYSY